MYDVIRSVLEKNAGCCLDNEEEIEKVASQLQLELVDWLRAITSKMFTDN